MAPISSPSPSTTNTVAARNRGGGAVMASDRSLQVSQGASRQAFLMGMGIVYAIAFLSIYLQLPGLFGATGIIPAQAQLEKAAKGDNWLQHLIHFPTALWLHEPLGQHVDTMVDLVALTGIALSFLSAVFWRMRCLPVYVLLWCCYFSLYQVGQTFLFFQWDILLLEVGFLAAFAAPVVCTRNQYHPGGDAVMAMVRWLFFRLMFLSGIVKLTSQCPTWWGLTAMDVHYESQCIPTPLAWFAHQLPHWFQAFSVVQVYVIESLLPFGFFVPFSAVRITCAVAQVLLMVLIFITGNYNFFNILTALLAIAVLYDNELKVALPTSFLQTHATKRMQGLRLMPHLPRWVEALVFAVAAAATVAFTARAFDIRVSLDSPEPIKAAVAFSRQEFAYWLTRALEAGIALGAVGVAVPCAVAIVSTLRRGRVGRFLSVAIRLPLIALLFLASIETLHWNDGNFRLHTLQGYWAAKESNALLNPLHAVNPYGLFRRMTGVGGRPEVSVEGSRDGEVWHEYVFRYKPGDVARAPPFVAPHQPRLDWQMWFAALGTVEHNPWLQHLAVRLLDGEPAVLDLMAPEQPEGFAERPPKFVRMRHWTYAYTTLNETYGAHPALEGQWWKREEKPGLYLVPISLESHAGPIRNIRHYFLNGRTSLSPVDESTCAQSWLCWGVHTIRQAVRGRDERAVMAGLLVTMATLQLIPLFLFSTRNSSTAAAAAPRDNSNNSKRGKSRPKHK